MEGGQVAGFCHVHATGRPFPKQGVGLLAQRGVLNGNLDAQILANLVHAKRAVDLPCPVVTLEPLGHGP